MILPTLLFKSCKGRLIMTRGTFFLITNEKVWRSIEFNGDMYPEGYGDEALKLITEVKTCKEFKIMVKKFNVEHHNYRDITRVVTPMPYRNCKKGDPGFFDGNNYVDFSNGYFDNFRFFSDWLFIKNNSSYDIEAKQANGEMLSIPSNAAIRLNHGDTEKEGN